MVKLKEIHRTSAFAWSPSPSLPLLATGTVAGALDESFSNNGQLEIWAPDFLNKNEYDLGAEGQTGPKASVTTTSRFNRLAWGYADGGRDRGVLVAGMENGDLDIWDPSQILVSADPTESLILRNKTHTGPIRGLDFNPIQTNLFSSGAVQGEIYIWDLKDPSKPYSPGTRSTKLDEITSLAWNHHVQYALAASSSTGYTVVWDLRMKREVAALAYGGGAGTQAGLQGFGTAGLVGGRGGMSDVAWHPDNATRLVTSSEDDMSPVIMVWDLRNARAPEKILTGHEKGVLSLSWCKQDADLLLSCGKDNRALCWNPQTSEIIGELPSADNWAFQVDWCPRNPDLFATAFFDGTIGIHSIQSTNESETPAVAPALKDASDVFDQPGFSRASTATLSLKQPPKWLRRPISGAFGYGGKLVTVSNLPGAHGKHQSGVAHIRTVVTESSIVERANNLQSAIDSGNLNSLAEERSESAEDESSAGWKALLSLFKANSRDELITLLGFSKAEVAERVADAVSKLKASVEKVATSPTELDVTETVFSREPVVSFAVPERDETPPESPVPGQEHEDDTLEGGVIAAETTPSEVSASATSDTTRLADGESTTTAPSLFGDEIAGTPQTDAAADFFGSIGVSRTDDVQPEIPHHNYALDSSVAATIGSRPSSVASESLKSNTFRIYPNDESDADQLITKALVLGDFDSAVSLCLSAERFADAILLAVRGGPELLQRTQKAYFERRTAELPYLRLFQSIVTNDLEDIVQNADLQEWQEIFVVLCTFASQEDFSGLAEQLGQRLEFQASLAKASVAAGAEEHAKAFRKNATLTYLAAGRLERLINIWIEELAEEEANLLARQEELHGSRYTAHAHALQTFIEKVTVFRSAVSYKDAELEQPTVTEAPEARTYKLSGLYDRYFEYADLLAAQGLVKQAVAFLKLTPAEYHGAPTSRLDFSEGRKRLQIAAGIRVIEASTSAIAGPSTAPARSVPASITSNSYGYGTYAPAAQTFAPQVSAPALAQAQPTYGAYGAPAYGSTPTVYTPATVGQPTYPAAGAQNPYASGAYGQPPVPVQPQQNVPLPPPPRGGTPTTLPPPPKAGPIKRDNGGWNDAPSHVNVAQRRTPSQLGAKPNAITSPFPNAPIPMAPPTPPIHGQPQAGLPPPPRPGSVQQRGPQTLPPPPRHGIPPQQVAANQYPPHMRPPSGPPGVQTMPPPPGPIMSPPQGAGVQRGPPPTGPYPPPPQRGHLPQSPPVAGGQLPPGPPPFRGTPSPNFARATSPPEQSGPYAPPPQAGFAPPPQQGFAHIPPQGIPRPGPSGPSGMAPPPGPATAPAAPAPPKAKPAPPQPKYPPGDRSHIPDNLMPVYNVLSEQLNFVKQTTPPQQKRMVEDFERRLNPLFDALNCETLSPPVCEQLIGLTQAMAARDREAALALHIDLLRTGSATDDIALSMTAIKQLILRL